MRLALLLLLPTYAFAQLQIQDSHTKESLRGLSVVDKNVIWASGTHGTYVLTTDGGKNWTAHQVPGAEDLDFRGVKAFGAEAFLLASGTGDKSRIYHTSNLGKHWELQFTNPEPKGFFDSMDFSDPRHGIAVGDPVNGKIQILQTKDGGKNWRLADSANMPPAINGEGSFAASNSCIAIVGQKVWFVTGGPAARVFHSEDKGTTWSVADSPIVHGSPSQGIFSVAFRDALHGVIVGGDYAHPEAGGATIALTQDGGKTWNLITPGRSKFFSGVAFVNENSVAITGSNATAFSSDGLHSWNYFLDQGFNAVDSNRGITYAVGANGRIAMITGGDAADKRR